ncbi:MULTISPECIES: hypothetical protein [Pseudoalteromonas]|uniref:Uncharacterized protein n=1 Tax=Pseudoalteromonas luteoviolacea (strain 2ta16) TaxID=1353533 RepID=V4HKX1_PSEL2|nr:MULTISPECIES: hypothetical protein [Pseudoalteromonas]ESP91465.1 hypothetical protein PL2TA16_00264 [Pseudoalteromonas luteoviolacea 2ta16]KZN40114.1 hypothetical protein N483_18165 [Pseudoalteromonas luteoviolacea NCIMB 1944]MCG7551197.1 hypothetical protein [Pseudoalteromonas sp. Of7M-16]
MKIFNLLILLMISVSLKCFATGQIPDSITIKNIEYRLHTNPLKNYLAKINWQQPDNISISTAN